MDCVSNIAILKFLAIFLYVRFNVYYLIYLTVTYAHTGGTAQQPWELFFSSASLARTYTRTEIFTNFTFLEVSNFTFLEV